MSAHDNLTRMMDNGIVAVIRADSGELLADVAEALLAGGVDVMEVTFTVPNAIDVIKEVKRRIGDKVLLGAGTVLDTETARAAILAGAEFIVSPSTDVDVIKLCRRYDTVVTPGIFTPTEAVTAWEAGADILKVFPADIGGPAHLKALRGPLPQCR
ncbi:MAG: 2-dehydro-3-deoxyphosphogluconate aldolase, partial [Planctomycetaceae bacterium]|nr:2-dehydro-3-deoxyphosphogluconate aldolase [Planctomycetaceae bacterium]